MAEVEASLRHEARACLEAAVAAVEPRTLVAAELETRPFEVGREIQLIAIGKAAAAMTAGAVDALGDALVGGVVILPELSTELANSRFDVSIGGHPVPNAEGVRGAAAVKKLAESLDRDDQLLVLISGGGSALMTLPVETLTLEDLQATTRLLLRAGADIHQLNAVRKHLDQLKGGRLARLAAPSKVRALILSDVVGDSLDVIASGPLSADSTTFHQVVEIFDSFGLWQQLPASVVSYVQAGAKGEVAESPGPEDPCFAGVTAKVVGNNRRAADAALGEAQRRGFKTLLLSTSWVGEAREAGGFLAAIAREIRRSGQPLAAPACVIAAGETTVTVRGSGKGGRNQEVALAAAQGIDGEAGVLIAGFGTDGIDGPTNAAGAFADGRTVRRAKDQGLSVQDFLRRNDAYHFFAALDDLILTGATGTNVMDLSLLLVR